MKSILSLVDIYAYKIKMTLNQEERISTSLGRTLSVLTFFILVVFTWFVGNDFVYRKNPVSYVDEKISSDYPKILMTPEYFPIAFGLTNEYGAPMKNDSLIETKLIQTQLNFNIDPPEIKTEIELEPCKKDHFPSIDQKQFVDASIELFYCPKLNSNLFLEGSFISYNLTSLSFVAYKCDYKKHPDKCGTKEEIDKYITKNVLNYNIFYIENYISIGDYLHPLQTYIINKWKFFQTAYKKITNYNLQENYLKTDSAVFSTNFEEIKYGKLIEEPTDWIDYDEDDRRLAMMNIHSSNISQRFYRKYIKLSEILASVGGLIKISILFFTFLH